MDAPIVIVGAGQAGMRAAETLRKQGCEERILLFGEEAHPPYQRPPLSKKFLLGEMSEAQLFLQGENFFEQNEVELVTDTRVLAIEPGARRVQVSGSAALLEYSKLLLTTGCRPRMLNLPGAESVDLETLRSIDDVNRLRQKVTRAERPVIIGGGYIGLEVAAVLRMMGKPVTLLEAQDRLLGRVTSLEISAFFHKLHSGHGVDLRLNAKVSALQKSGEETIIELEGGEKLATDLVLVAIGAVANDELAREAGLPCQDGILIDTFCQSTPEILAAGDCARFPLPRYSRLVRLESVQNANDQSRAAAQTILGNPSPYDPVPWFWSDQYDVKFQIAGLGDGYDALETEGDPDSNSFAISYFKGGQLIAVDAVNNPRAHMMARRTLAQADGAAKASNP